MPWVRPGNVPVEIRSASGTVVNHGPGTVFYGDDPSVRVDSFEGSLAPGATTPISGTLWFVSATPALVEVGEVPGADQISTAQLGSGSATATTFLRGDRVWATAGGGGGSGADGIPTVINATDPPYNMATANTAAANRQAVLDAIAALPAAGGTVYIPSGVYLWPYLTSGPTISRSNVTIWMADACVLDFSAGPAAGASQAFTVSGTMAARGTATHQFLTAIANEGDTTVTIPDSSVFAIGDYFMIGSNEMWDPGEREGIIGEIRRVTSIPSSTTIATGGYLSDGPYFPGARVTPTPTTLSAGIDAVVTTIPVGNATSYMVPYQNHPGLIQIDSEVMTYTAKNDNTFLGVVRGARSTVAATHASGATVTELPWTTTLNGAITNTATSIVLTSAVGFSGGVAQLSGYVQIDSEKIFYASKSGNTLTGCVRGVAGTTAASHLTLATVTEIYGAFVAKMTPAENVQFVGGEIRGPLLPASDNNFYRGIVATNTSRFKCIGTRFVNCKTGSVWLENSVDFLVDSIYSEFSDRNNYGYGVAVTYACQDGKVVNSTFRISRHSITFGAAGGQGVYGIPRRIIIANNHSYGSNASSYDVHAGGEGIKFISNYSVNGGDCGFWINTPWCELINNTIVKPNNFGMWINNLTPQPSRYTITGNTLLGRSQRAALGGGGIYVTIPSGDAQRPNAGFDTRSIVVSGNSIEYFKNAGIAVAGSSATGAGQVARLPGVTIVNNVVSGIRLNFNDPAISIGYLFAPTVTGNVVHDCVYNAIQVGQVIGGVLSGNAATYRTPIGGGGIQLTTSTDVAVTGNHVTRGSVGVAFADDCNNCTAMGNTLRGCTTPVSRGAGAGHIVATTDNSGAYNRT